MIRLPLPRPVLCDLCTTDPGWRFHWPIALGFAALCIALSYPGRLNGDSLYSLMTADLPGHANNWHSATLVWFWSLPAGWLGQPGGALAMQALLFGLFAGYLPRPDGGACGRLVLTGELVLRAGLAGCAGYIGKDAVMVLTLLIAVQLARRSATQHLSRTEWGLLGIVAVLFVLAKAPNALVLTAAAALILPFLVANARSYVALVTAALALGLLAVPLNRAVDADVFGARDLHPDKQLVLFDLGGIAVETGTDPFAGIPGWPRATLPPPVECYMPNMWDGFAHWTRCGGYARAYDVHEAALKRQWLAQIAAHPLAWLHHRIRYTGYLMVSREQASWGLGGRSSNDASDPAAIAELRRGMADLGITQPIASWHPRPIAEPFRILERALFAFPKVQWVGLLLCLGILLLGWLRRADGIRMGAIVAAASGAGNVAVLMVFGVADPGRYLLPTVALGYVALLAWAAPSRASSSASVVSAADGSCPTSA